MIIFMFNIINTVDAFIIHEYFVNQFEMLSSNLKEFLNRTTSPYFAWAFDPKSAGPVYAGLTQPMINISIRGKL